MPSDLKVAMPAFRVLLPEDSCVAPEARVSTPVLRATVPSKS